MDAWDIGASLLRGILPVHRFVARVEMSDMRRSVEIIRALSRAYGWLCVAALAIVALAWHVRGDRLAISTTALLCIAMALAWRHRTALQREHRSQTAAEEARRHQHAVLTAMHETSLALMNRSDLTAVLATIVTRAGAFFDAPHGFVVLVQPDGYTLRSAYDTGCFLSVQELPIHRGEGVSGRVWETGKPVVIDDYPAWKGRLTGAADLPIHTAVGVPLSADGCLLGVLGLAREEPGTRFLDHEVALLIQFAQLAAIAIDNVRLFRESQTSAAQYRLLFESNPQPMWVFDTETLRFLAVNNAALAHYGYTRDEFLAMTTAEIRPPEEVERLYRFLAQHKEDYQPTGVWHHRKRDGTPIDMEITSYAIDFDGHPARIALAIDVTEQERAQASLQQSEARFRAQYQGNPVAIYTWQRTDDDYVFIDYNAAADATVHGLLSV